MAEDRRHARTDWRLSPGTPNSDGGTNHTHENIQCALLMDLRDQLDRLLGILECRNFLDIPRLLRRTEQNTRRPKKKPTLKAVKRRSA